MTRARRRGAILKGGADHAIDARPAPVIGGIRRLINSGRQAEHWRWPFGPRRNPLMRNTRFFGRLEKNRCKIDAECWLLTPSVYVRILVPQPAISMT
jgi:hypothetical protein